MSSQTIDLSSFNNSFYNCGRNKFVVCLWFFLGAPLVRSRLNPSSAMRRAILKLFGAEIGAAVIMRPGLKVKFPWLLSVGANAWLGEDCWIDNLGTVSIGQNACLSQGTYLCTGNHDWSDPAFGLIVRPISVGNGAWIGAKSVILPGVAIGDFGVATAGSVVAQKIPPFEIHAGNPAKLIHRRVIQPKKVTRDQAE